MKDEEVVGAPIRINYGLIDVLWHSNTKSGYTFLKENTSYPKSVRFSAFILFKKLMINFYFFTYFI